MSDDGDDEKVRLSGSTVETLVAALLFAHEVIVRELAEDPRGSTTLHTAALYGLCLLRSPTSEELEDPDWPGHWAGVDRIGHVVTVSPDFAGLVATINS